MDFVKILGGLALGATGAALYDALRAPKKTVPLGQGVVGGFGGGGAGGGGFGGGGPGVVGGFGGGPSGGGGFGGGPGVVSFAGGAPSSGGGGGPGLVIGPPSGSGEFGGGLIGPEVVQTPEGEGGVPGPMPPIISVPPEFTGPGFPGGGDSFFGISASPWFWPLNVNWMFPRPPRSMVCVETKNANDEKVTYCQESYAAQPLFNGWPQYTWGPPAGWL